MSIVVNTILFIYFYTISQTYFSQSQQGRHNLK